MRGLPRSPTRSTCVSSQRQEHGSPNLKKFCSSFSGSLQHNVENGFFCSYPPKFQQHTIWTSVQKLTGTNTQLEQIVIEDVPHNIGLVIQKCGEVRMRRLNRDENGHAGRDWSLDEFSHGQHLLAVTREIP